MSARLANINKQEGLWYISGSMVLPQVELLLIEAKQAFTKTRHIIDLSGVTEIDTSALSLLLEWLRLAQSAKCELLYQNLPNNLIALASLYEVLDMIPTTNLD